MPAAWDPAQYLAFADERTRPFVDLLARVDATPARIVDLGCGPGHLTALLHARWPRAAVTGVDSSADMITRARREHADRPTGEVAYVVADLRAWRAEQPVDLLVSAATFQWVPEHLLLLPRLADAVAPGGTFAFTVPANFDAPSHRLLRDLAARQPYAAYAADVEQPAAHDAATYLEALARPGWRIDAWETTYLHVLEGPDPVLRWISGTGARPVLQALPNTDPDDLRGRFERAYAAALREAYPPTPHGTVLPFRRVFVVARRVAGSTV
ncbi:methyltransferase domain-containing protein [soil metagenome]